MIFANKTTQQIYFWHILGKSGKRCDIVVVVTCKLSIFDFGKMTDKFGAYYMYNFEKWAHLK